MRTELVLGMLLISFVVGNVVISPEPLIQTSPRCGCNGFGNKGFGRWASGVGCSADCSSSAWVPNATIPSFVISILSQTKTQESQDYPTYFGIFTFNTTGHTGLAATFRVDVFRGQCSDVCQMSLYKSGESIPSSPTIIINDIISCAVQPSALNITIDSDWTEIVATTRSDESIQSNYAGYGTSNYCGFGVPNACYTNDLEGSLLTISTANLTIYTSK